MISIEGLSRIADQYDGMLIDQFGVLHDGARLYPGSLGVLAELHRLGIPVAVMTNSGRRAAANVARLTQMGIPRDHFVDAVSSGEVAHDLLRGTAAKRAFIIGRTGDEYGFDYFELVERPQDADIILILGTDVPRISLADYGRLLNGITVPAICCNPDKLMITSSGLQPAPGAIAALYEAQGGKVRWIGKPYRDIYDSALKVIGRPKRVLCIGDSAEHDVGGGRGAGLTTLLVRTGVSEGLTQFEPEPDYLLERFTWR
ncbi:TIGR01459 family HAD-type hydrolase [Taklimakanibacter lacteus]|uniref:TIGR01459 family HAD-type hydrolase n=1 Tax=Taklimakanibacter lacteus TaxID=2268456 RepID=UPI0013C47517